MKLFQRKAMFATTGYDSPPTAPSPSSFAGRLGGMSGRERRLLLGAVAVVFLAILWWLALAPALNTLAKAPEQVGVLETQLIQMRQQATEIESLRQAPTRTPPADFAGTIQARIKAALGEGTRVSGTPAQVVLTAPTVSASALLALMQDVAEAAQAKVDSLTLTRNPDGSLRAEVKWVPRANS
jgi:general secretion pathway protein M